MSGGRGAGPHKNRSRRLLSFLALAILPWTVITWPGGIQLVALWGLVTPAPLQVVTLPEYLFVLTAGLPDRLLAWPTSALLYVAGLATMVAHCRYRFDARLPTGLFGLAALAHLGFAVGVVARGTATVLPVGPVLVGLAIWWYYWPSIRRGTARER